MAEERLKRRRLPSRHACIGCRKRKHRCDGERPECGNCRSRWITCLYSSDATTSSPSSLGETGAFSASNIHNPQRGGSEPRHTPTLMNRQQIQQQLVQQQPSSLSILNPSTETSGLDILWSASADHLRVSGDSVHLAGPLPHQSNNIQPGVSAELQNSASNPSSPSDSGGPDGYFGDSSTFAFVSKVQPESQNNNGVHLQNSRYQPTGGNANCKFRDKETVYELPERHLADSLIDGYFDRVHPLYPFVHETSFRAEYEKMWANLSGSILRPSWYALLNLVFALGCEFCDAIPEGKVMTTVSPFVARSRDIIFSHIFKKGNLELIQALLLMCHYLQGTLELNECWNLVGLMIRTAVTIGLHLNPDGFSLSTVEREVRKRVWWGCFIIDRTLSMKFGRPPSIQAADVYDVPLPLPVDDQYIHDDSLAPRQPACRPSATAFFIHTIKLSKVIDNILRDLYTTNKRASRQAGVDTMLPESSNQSQFFGHAVLLDGQLQSWWEEVPAHLRPESVVADGQIFQRQQTVMQVRYLQIRILLQRQLLLIFSRQQIDDHFLRAIAIAGSQTCIYAARQTVQIIYGQYHRRLLNSLWYNLHYIFTSMGVLLHVQMMDKSRLELLGQELEQETLECGMEFLKSAGNTSNLAAKYVTMLQRVRNQTKQWSKDNVQSNRMHGNGFGLASQQTRNLEASKSPLTSTAQPQFQAHGQQNSQGDIDLDGMNFDDLLFGTGLPQDVLSFNYPNGGFLL